MKKNKFLIKITGIFFHLTLCYRLAVTTMPHYTSYNGLCGLYAEKIAY
jgi:hypothetical protein